MPIASNGIRDIYCYVTDMPRAVAFYREVLGAKVVSEDPHWSSLTLHGMTIGLHGADVVPRVDRNAHGAKAGWTLTILVDDIDAAHQSAIEAGATVLGEVSRNPWGDLFAMEDPDGNVIKVGTRPG